MTKITLDMHSTGQWIVLTEASLYLLDMDARTITRSPYGGMGPDSKDTKLLVASLRQDNSALPLVDLLPVKTGEPMSMIVDVRKDGFLTSRHTTHVRMFYPTTQQ